MVRWTCRCKKRDWKLLKTVFLIPFFTAFSAFEVEESVNELNHWTIGWVGNCEKNPCYSWPFYVFFVGSEGDEAEIKLNEHLLQGELPSPWKINGWMFPNIWETPQIIHFGYPYFWKHPHGTPKSWRFGVWLEDDFPDLNSVIFRWTKRDSFIFRGCRSHLERSRHRIGMLVTAGWFRLQVMEAHGRFPTNFRWRPTTYPWEPYAWEATPCVWPCRMCFGQWLVDTLGLWIYRRTS